MEQQSQQQLAAVAYMACGYKEVGSVCGKQLFRSFPIDYTLATSQRRVVDLSFTKHSIFPLYISALMKMIPFIPVYITLAIK